MLEKLSKRKADGKAKEKVKKYEKMRDKGLMQCFYQHKELSMKNNKTVKRAKRHAELKSQYLTQPGMKEMLDIYDRWQMIDKALQAHQDIKEQNYIIANSDNSNPKTLPASSVARSVEAELALILRLRPA